MAPRVLFKTLSNVSVESKESVRSARSDRTRSPRKGLSRMAKTPPSAKRSPFSFLPVLKDWVLVRTKSKMWKDAVPALVTKVTEGLSLNDCSVGLVLPNRLALNFNFRTAKPFLELFDVALQDIRPYTGSDQADLRAVLLKAIRDSCLSGQVSRSLPSLSEHTTASDHEPLDQLAPGDGQEEEKAAEDPVRQDRDVSPDAVLVSSVGSGVPVEETDVSEGRRPLSASSVDVGVPAEDDTADLGAMRTRTSPADEVDAAIETELAEALSDEIEAAQVESAATEPAGGVTPPASTVEAEKADVSAEILLKMPDVKQQRAPRPDEVSSTADSKRESTPDPRGAERPKTSASRSRHAEFTRLVSQAFLRVGGAMELSRQEIAAAVGAAFSDDEVKNGLAKLEAENKVFLSGELVFLLI